MNPHDPDLEELERVDFAFKALARRRAEVIRAIARRRRTGDQQAMSRITGLHRTTIAAIASGQNQRTA